MFCGNMLSAAGPVPERLPRGIDLNDYPQLDRQEVGHLRYTDKIVRQDLDDFRLLPSGDLYGLPKTGGMQMSMASYRYSLAFMAYFLAIEQFHKVPANTGMIKPLLDRIIQKMQRKAVWDYWASTSMVMPHFEPNFDRPYPSLRDPIKIKNIMYSGHLAQMIGLYEKLYADLKWSAPGSLVFAWSDKEKYVYDQNTLIKVIYDQFINMPDHCIQCEPNVCFPVCNQHPMLALMLYDQAHGTDYFGAAAPPMLDWMYKTGMVDAKTHEVAVLWLIKQQRRVVGSEIKFDSVLDHFSTPLSAIKLIKFNSSAIAGWNGAFLNVWQPDLVKRDYPFQVKSHVKVKGARLAYCVRDGLSDQLSTPFFALLAAEMGDLSLRDKLMNWSERQYKATWDKEGGYYYPPSIEFPITFLPGMTHKGITLTDKVAAMARANIKDGVRKLHTLPFAGADPAAPRVENPDFPRVVLTRAVYDEAKQALIVSTADDAPYSGVYTLEFTHLDRAKVWTLFVDGISSATYRDKESVTITLKHDKRHDLVLFAN